MHKLYMTLQFYATGSYQWLVGSSGRISQSATSHAILQVTDVLVAVAPILFAFQFFLLHAFYNKFSIKKWLQIYTFCSLLTVQSKLIET
jgi:hypothetical protein